MILINMLINAILTWTYQNERFMLFGVRPSTTMIPQNRPQKTIRAVSYIMLRVLMFQALTYTAELRDHLTMYAEVLHHQSAKN